MSQITVEQIKAMMPVVPAASGEAHHIGRGELPYVDIGDGTEIRVVHVDLKQGLWVIWNRFRPGARVGRHYHTGPVFGVTLSGCWYYEEYPHKVNRPGSYLFEPAGSVHTLIVPEENTEDTEVWFAIFGANVQLDSSGGIEHIIDAATILGGYRLLCQSAEQSTDAMLVVS